MGFLRKKYHFKILYKCEFSIFISTYRLIKKHYSIHHLNWVTLLYSNLFTIMIYFIKYIQKKFTFVFFLYHKVVFLYSSFSERKISFFLYCKYFLFLMCVKQCEKCEIKLFYDIVPLFIICYAKNSSQFSLPLKYFTTNHKLVDFNCFHYFFLLYS